MGNVLACLSFAGTSGYGSHADYWFCILNEYLPNYWASVTNKRTIEIENRKIENGATGGGRGRRNQKGKRERGN